MKILLKGGTIINPANGEEIKSDILIENEYIKSIKPSIDETADEVIDCKGKYISPGLIDMHVHLREPGYEYKETIASGARAAAAGGFTSIVAMPNTSPAVDNAAMVEFVLKKGKEADVRVLTTGAATKGNNGAEMAEIGDMISSGACAISDDAFPIQNADLMRMIMQYSKMFDKPVLVHSEDKSMTASAVMNEGTNCTILGLKPWPRQAEEIMIWRNILLSQLTDCAVHIQHVTTKGGVEAVKWAKERGLKITCETCPQYFSLTDDALKNYDSNAKCCPPLRTKEDVEAIKSALADGTIDVIATDHAPHAAEEKEVEIPDASFGMIGLETALSLVITNLVHSGVLSLSDAIKKMTIAPARILGLGEPAIKEGALADITVIDINKEYIVDKSEFKSLSKNTPFDGFNLKGKAATTIVGGKIVFQSK
ncbi:MAG: dihydroorotase [Armatimonadota bacterium]